MPALNCTGAHPGRTCSRTGTRTSQATTTIAPVRMVKVVMISASARVRPKWSGMRSGGRKRYKLVLAYHACKRTRHLLIHHITTRGGYLGTAP